MPESTKTTNKPENIAATAQPPPTTEKPSHYTYLKGFRVDQCALFLQHKCTQHRPYTCFYWHFRNQRRRRPMRRRDGTFNYNPDVYCEKYDEQSGSCPAGDDCGLAHRNAGDTEKRYHLRYYKTAMCIHETDAKGFCSKNGVHCAYAHSAADLRPPVYDAKELQTLTYSNTTNNNALNINSSSSSSSNSSTSSESVNDEKATSKTASAVSSSTSTSLPLNEKVQHLAGSLEKERALNEDPKWNDTNYVLENYKTEICKRPLRLCRQGFACPQYHNTRDRRRNPIQLKYRSTPCPQVKQGDEWLEPSVCDSGDSCKYCHSRTEQQFHPEIYKSTRCNDMGTTGYCPRGVFCAFAHVDSELKTHTQRAYTVAAASSSGDSTNSTVIATTTLESFMINALPSKSPVPASYTSNNSSASSSSSAAVAEDSAGKEGQSSLLSSSTTFAGVVLGSGNLNEEISAKALAQVQANNASLIQTLASNQLLSALVAAAASQQQQQQIQMQQSMLAAAASYTKPIGSEREKQQPPKLTQLQQNSSSTSSSSSSPNISTSANANNLTPNSPSLNSTSTSAEMTARATTPNNHPQLEVNVNGKISGSLQQQHRNTPPPIAPPPGVMFNSMNGILGISASNLNSSSQIMNDVEKDKLLSDLKKQTDMSNKLEALCLQYRQWVDKLTNDVSEWKDKYIRAEEEKKILELQFLNSSLSRNKNSNNNNNNYYYNNSNNNNNSSNKSVHNNTNNTIGNSKKIDEIKNF